MLDNETIIRHVQQAHEGHTLDHDDPLLIANTVTQLAQQDFIKDLVNARPAMTSGDLKRIAREILTEVNKMQVRQLVLARRGLLLGAFVVGVSLFGLGLFVESHVTGGMPVVTNCKASPQPAGEAFDCLFWTKPPAKEKR